MHRRSCNVIFNIRPKENKTMMSPINLSAKGFRDLKKNKTSSLLLSTNR